MVNRLKVKSDRIIICQVSEIRGTQLERVERVD